jgi:hypothetical protein
VAQPQALLARHLLRRTRRRRRRLPQAKARRLLREQHKHPRQEQHRVRQVRAHLEQALQGAQLRARRSARQVDRSLHPPAGVRRQDHLVDRSRPRLGVGHLLVVRVLALVVEHPIEAVHRLPVVAQVRLVVAVHLAAAAVVVVASVAVHLAVVVVASAVVREDLLPVHVVVPPEGAVRRSDVRVGVVAISKSSSQVR